MRWLEYTLTAKQNGKAVAGSRELIPQQAEQAEECVEISLDPKTPVMLA
jgi:hypothetical protein